MSKCIGIFGRLFGHKFKNFEYYTNYCQRCGLNITEQDESAKDKPLSELAKSTESIDEILEDYWSAALVWQNSSNHPNNYMKDKFDEAKQAILDLIKQAQLDLLERVGEEIDVDGTKISSYHDLYSGRDKEWTDGYRRGFETLKAFQREALNRIKESL